MTIIFVAVAVSSLVLIVAFADSKHFDVEREVSPAPTILQFCEEEFVERRYSGEDLRIIDRVVEETPDGPLTTLVCVKE